MEQALRIVFAGTPDFAARPLSGLLARGWPPVAVYTQPDRPAGRGRQQNISPVKQVALEAGLPVYQPQSLRDPEAVLELKALQPDLLVVVAYGLILPPDILAIPRLGCINVHASLLPRWRGTAPIQRAIQAGDTVSGVTLMLMEEGLDTGPMISTASTPITEQTTGGELHDVLAQLGSDLLVQFLPQAESASAAARPQPEEGVSYAAKLSKSEARLDWQQTAAHLARTIRAFNPWPVCWFDWQGQAIRVWAASAAAGPEATPGKVRQPTSERVQIATAEGWLELLEIQPAGRKRMAVQDWLRGGGQHFADSGVLA